MDLLQNQIDHGFQLIQEEMIEEVEGKGRVFYHPYSGAKLIQLATKDENKVFSIAIRTFPEDDSGVAHIVEHAVCCASTQFPLKDTFMEMEKGSVNNALNACTYKDMTMYYCATTHSKDLMNLIEVYMDLVFYPLLEKRPYLFSQEGWHYDLEEMDGQLTYSGIVYHEMQGEFQEASTLLEYYLHKTLFPDTIYKYDTGGVPEQIVKLKRENFLYYYKQFYHPSNTTFYFYGEEELPAILSLLDKVLQNFPKKNFSFQTQVQPINSITKQIKATYPALEETDKVVLALSFVVGIATDTELRLAMSILEHMLLKSAASPLLKSLIEEKQIGSTLEESGYDTSKYQPTFTITLKGCKKQKEKQFYTTCMQTLKQLAEEGIEKELLEAAICSVTFGLEEGAQEGEPKGVLYGEEIVQNYYYEGEVFSHLKFRRILEKIEKVKDKGYFETLIKTYFLDNLHYTCLTLAPAKSMQQLEEQRIKEFLSVYQKGLTKRQLETIYKENQLLERMQAKENSKEALKKLPHLKRQDLPTELEPILVKEQVVDGIKIAFTPEENTPILYMHMLFDLTAIVEEDIPYVALLANLLTYISTENYAYNQLENKINQHTGGLNCSIQADTKEGSAYTYTPYFKVSMKLLLPQMDTVGSLLKEIFTSTLWTEEKKIEEIIKAIHYELERSFVAAPEYRGIKRLYASFLPVGEYEDRVSGIQYYYFLGKIKDVLKEKKAISLLEKLQQVYHQIFSRDKLRIHIMGKTVSYPIVLEKLKPIYSTLPNEISKPINTAFKLFPKKEAIIVASNLQTIVKGIDFSARKKAFKGSMYVVSNLLESTYLWDRVRLDGGAYGCDMSINREGNIILCSYYDPNLGKTLEVYDNMGLYLKELFIEKAVLEKHIISTVGAFYYPVTFEQKSERSLHFWLGNRSNDFRQKEYEEILDTTKKDIKEVAEILVDDNNKEALCIIGSKKAIQKEKALFSNIINIPEK